MKVGVKFLHFDYLALSKSKELGLQCWILMEVFSYFLSVPDVELPEYRRCRGFRAIISHPSFPGYGSH
ncbi:MAG TPA: hypothetical protein ENG66_03715 [Thermococcus sp.]|nr:hypothetical protein [Thermococcus sp.]